MSIKRDCLELFYHYKAKTSNKRGISRVKRKTPIIVSLTSWQKRYQKLYLTLETLLNQTLQPDHILVWLPESDIFKDHYSQSDRGIEFRYCKDIGPFTKIIYTLQEFSEAIIVTCDDDIIYKRKWLEELYTTYINNPDYIICHRAHLMQTDKTGTLLSYNDWIHESKGICRPSLRLFPTGVGGVLYPPGSLHEDVLDIDLFKKLCPKADDVWLKAMSLLKQTMCLKVRPCSKKLVIMKETQDYGLINDNMTQNDIQIKQVFDHYKLNDIFV